MQKALQLPKNQEEWINKHLVWTIELMTIMMSGLCVVPNSCVLCWPTVTVTKIRREGLGLIPKIRPWSVGSKCTETELHSGRDLLTA